MTRLNGSEVAAIVCGLVSFIHPVAVRRHDKDGPDGEKGDKEAVEDVVSVEDPTSDSLGASNPDSDRDKYRDACTRKSAQETRDDRK